MRWFKLRGAFDENIGNRGRVGVRRLFCAAVGARRLARLGEPGFLRVYSSFECGALREAAFLDMRKAAARISCRDLDCFAFVFRPLRPPAVHLACGFSFRLWLFLHVWRGQSCAGCGVFGACSFVSCCASRGRVPTRSFARRAFPRVSSFFGGGFSCPFCRKRLARRRGECVAFCGHGCVRDSYVLRFDSSWVAQPRWRVVCVCLGEMPWPRGKRYSALCSAA